MVVIFNVTLLELSTSHQLHIRMALLVSIMKKLRSMLYCLSMSHYGGCITNSLFKNFEYYKAAPNNSDQL